VLYKVFLYHLACDELWLQTGRWREVYERCEVLISLNSRLCFQQADVFAMSETPSEVFLDLMTNSTQTRSGT